MAATTATTATSEPTTFLNVDTQAPSFKWWVAIIVLVAGATQTFAGTSINLVIPRLMAAFGTDLAQTQWVATGFLLTRTLVMPLLGWLGGLLGNRNMFVAIMIGFVLTTAGCGLSVNLTMMVVFRIVQGLILGTMEGLTAVILVNIFPPHQRGLALGLRAIGWSAGQVIFYALGGYLIDEISWRLVFFLGIPIGIAAAVFGWLVLPQQRDHKGEPVDYLGLLALASFLIPLLLAISFARDSNTETYTLILLGLGSAAGGALFVLRELTAPYPVVNLRLFRLPAFSMICTVAFLNNVGLFGALFMVPIFLQRVLGLTPMQAGLVIVPGLIGMAFSGVIAGKLSDLLAPPIVVGTMMVALSAIFFSLSSVTATTAITVIVVYVVLYRMCMIGVVTPMTLLLVQHISADQMRMGQGLLGVVRSIGGVLGVTVTSVFFERRRVWHQLTAYDTYNLGSPEHHQTLGDLTHYLHEAGILGASANQAALGTIRRLMDTEAIASAFQDSFMLICTCFVLACLPIVYLLLGRGRATSS